MTFLLSDIEGSTRLWSAHPDVMGAAVAASYAILDRAIAAHEGVRPIEQGEGDSVVGAFSRASSALAAALERWAPDEPTMSRVGDVDARRSARRRSSGRSRPVQRCRWTRR